MAENHTNDFSPKAWFTTMTRTTIQPMNPPMDGTASLTYYLSALQKDGIKSGHTLSNKNTFINGGIIRTDTTSKQITLIFTADDKADGAADIRDSSQRENKGFFFTGQVLQNVSRLFLWKNDGHYLGAHSNAPSLLLLGKRDSTLINRRFEKDLLANYELMNQAGIAYTDAPYFVPPTNTIMQKLRRGPRVWVYN